MPEPKEWTIMFYFASDNPLAISVVSQLKAIKAAGFHQRINVVTQFDPYTEGTPTHVFDVNLVNKLKSPRESIGGFSEKVPVIRTLIEDKLWRDERTRPVEEMPGELVRTALHRLFEKKGIDYQPPPAPFTTNGLHSNGNYDSNEPDPDVSLSEFLRFCADNYPAKHYMLFMLGHGVVVGNDIFMLDEHSNSKNSLSLGDLGRILTDFKSYIDLQGGVFELVSFHSCSVSSMEVAFQLQDTAKYMLASQGPAFVGSWPYREILIRIINALGENEHIDNVRELLLHLYNYCLLNSADYLLAGYSFQISLCDLTKISTLHEPIENLAQALIDGLNDMISRDFILLSHWKSQSFFNEMYTDLYDFCFCFTSKIEELRKSRGRVTPQLRAIELACNDVMDTLVKSYPKAAGDQPREMFIVAADSLGPAYQYSRGMSVYFPWSEPARDSHILNEYQHYRFTTEFENASWLQFLKDYFRLTMREVSQSEHDKRRPLSEPNATQSLAEDLASLVYSGEGLLNQDFALQKSDPRDKTGGDTESVSIKNYPRDIRSRRQRRRQAADERFPLSEGFNVLVETSFNGNGNQ